MKSLSISVLFFTIISFAQSVMAEKQRVAVYSSIGNEFVFFLPGTEDGLALGDSTIEKKLEKQFYDNYLQRYMEVILEQMGYEVVILDKPRDKTFMRRHNISRAIYLRKPKVGGDETPSGIGVMAHSKFLTDLFGVDNVNKQSTALFIHLEARVMKYHFHARPEERSFSTGIKTKPYEWKGEWPTRKNIENCYIKPYLVKHYEFLGPEMTALIQKAMGPLDKGNAPIHENADGLVEILNTLVL